MHCFNSKRSGCGGGAYSKQKNLNVRIRVRFLKFLTLQQLSVCAERRKFKEKYFISIVAIFPSNPSKFVLFRGDFNLPLLSWVPDDDNPNVMHLFNVTQEVELCFV